MKNTRRRGKELSAEELARTVLPGPEVQLLNGWTAGVRMLGVSVGLVQDPWSGPLQKVQPVMPGHPDFPGWMPAPPAAATSCGARPGLLKTIHPMEPASSASASPAEASLAEASPADGDPARAGVVREAMDGAWAYHGEDLRDPRLTSEGLRLTAESEDTVCQVLFARVVAHEQVIAWHRAQMHKLLAQAVQLPVPPSSSGPLPGGIDITGYELAEAELGALLHLSRVRAGAQLHLAVIMSTLPRFLRMMEAGELDEDRALAVARAMSVQLGEVRHPDPAGTRWRNGWPGGLRAGPGPSSWTTSAGR